jgi:hypothetical protein
MGKPQFLVWLLLFCGFFCGFDYTAVSWELKKDKGFIWYSF